MTETKELLRRGVGDFEPMPDAFDRVLVRRDRKRQNQRVAAGLLGIAVFALVAIGFVRLLGSERGPVNGPATESPSPVTQPPTPFTERFDSPINGLSIGYPSGWRARAATEPWGHGEVAFDAPDVDVIFDPTFREDVYLAVVSEALGDTSAQDWVYDMWRNLESVGICTRAVGSGGGGGTPFRDHYAWFEHCGTHLGTDDVLIVATATRGYIINLHVANDRLLQATFGHETDWFEAALKTVDLPEDEIDTLSPSGSP